MTDTINIKDVKVGERMRREFGDIEDLASSIARLGLLNPIVIDENNALVAGHRRLLACMHLGWEDIPFTKRSDLDDTTRKEIELEENIRRKDLTWVEEVSGLHELYDMKQERYGRRAGSRYSEQEGYGVDDAAKDLDRSVGSISMDLQLARGLGEFPDLAKEKTKAAAFKRYRRLRETKLRTEQARRTRIEDHTDAADNESAEEVVAALTDDEPKAGDPGTRRQEIKKIGWKGKGILYIADARDVLRTWPPETVDLIVCDPPYALGLFKEGQSTSGARLAEHSGTMYDDDPQRVMDMLDEVFMHAARVLKPDGHAYVFFHMTRYEPIYLMLRKHFGKCTEVPIIWIKNTPGIGDPNTSWVYAYEPCFFVNRGRSLVKPQAFNYLKYDTVQSKIHATEKPVQLLRHLISASALPGEVVLDPFAGSGSTLVAAHQLGCRFMGIEQHEPFGRATAERIAEALAEQAEGPTDAT